MRTVNSISIANFFRQSGNRGRRIPLDPTFEAEREVTIGYLPPLEIKPFVIKEKNDTRDPHRPILR